jgi:hypothetical protein
MAFVLQKPANQPIPSQWSPYLEPLSVRERPVAIQSLDGKQVFQSKESLIAQTKPLIVDPFLLNWSSGGRLRTPRTFKEDAWNSWLIGIFQDLTHSFPDIRLNLLDLFHGHIVWNAEFQEAFIIFHSKEYPSDLDPFHTQRALEFEPSLETFESSDQNFARRNLIWSFHRGVIWRLNTGKQSPLSEIIAGAEGSLEKIANTLPEGCFGEPIADLNIFKIDQKTLIWVY